MDILVHPPFPPHLFFLGFRGYGKREIIMTVKWGNPVSGIFYLFFSDASSPFESLSSSRCQRESKVEHHS